MPIQARPFLVTDDRIDEAAAVLAEAGGGLTVLFTSTRVDLERLSRMLSAAPGPILGCTAAGELGPEGVQEGTVVGVSMSGDIDAALFPIPGLRSLRSAEIGGQLEQMRRHIQRRPEGWSTFGIVLIDGLSIAEERLMAALASGLPDIQLVGGSAGDDLAFAKTGVWWEGAFREDMAVVCLVSTPQPWRMLKTQNIEHTETTLVITEAEPRLRLVREIDGEPAAVAYARAVGVPPEAVGPAIFSRHPLVLRIGGDTYVRAIQRVEPDGSLVFFCAIEEGLVMLLGRLTDLLPDLSRCLSEAREEVGEDAVVLGFDCILRRLEMIETGIVPEVSALIVQHNLIGFHTYGEQRNGLHVSQTFTGVAVGTR